MDMPLPPTTDPGADRPLPPPTPPPWRLVRARHPTIGGVCAGLATATGVNVTLVRLAFVVAGLSGVGILAYVLLAVLLPREGSAPGLTQRPAPPDTAKWLRVALVAVPILSITGILGGTWGGPFYLPFHAFGSGGGGIGFLLIGLGIFAIWLRRHRDDPRPPERPLGSDPMTPTEPTGPTWWQAPAVPPTTASPTPAAADEDGVADADTPAPIPAVDASGASSDLTAVRGIPVPRRQGRPVNLVIARIFAWLAVIAAFLTAAAAIFLERVGALSVPKPVLAWGVAALAIGGIVVAASWAKSALAVVASIALLAVPLVLITTLSSWDGGVGDRTVAPASLGPAPQDYRLAIGRLTVDLANTELTGETATVTATSRIGTLEILVPAGTALTVDAHVSAGQSRILGQERSGLNVTDHRTDTPTGATGSLHLDVEVAAGQLTVCRVPTPTAPVAPGCEALVERLAA